MHQVEGVHLFELLPVVIACRHLVDVPPVRIAARRAWSSWPRTRSRASTWSSCSTSRWVRPAPGRGRAPVRAAARGDRWSVHLVELATHQVEGVRLFELLPVVIACRHLVDVPPVRIAARRAWSSWPCTWSNACTWSTWWLRLHVPQRDISEHASPWRCTGTDTAAFAKVYCVYR